MRLSRRVAMAGVAYAFAVTMIGTTTPTPLYPLYQGRLHFSGLIVTIVYATYGVGVIAALLFMGPLSDRFGRRRILLPGLAFAAASSVVFLLAQSLGVLFVGRVLSGLSAGIFTGTATAALLDLAPPSGRERATLIAAAVNTGGLGLGPLLAGALAELAPDPLRTPYAVHLGLLVPAAVLVWLMPEPASVSSESGDRGGALVKLGVPAEVRATFVRAATAAFAAFATLGLFTAVAPAFLGKLLGLSNHALTGVVVFVLFASSTVGQFAAMRFAPVRALRIACLGMIAGMAVVGSGLAASSLALLLAGAVIAGMGTGLAFRSGLTALNAEAPAEQRGEINSTYFFVAYLALSVPIIGVGVASEAIGLRAAGLIFSGCVALLSLIVLVSLGRRLSSGHREQPPDKPRSAATADSTGSR